jgi:uncharacterized protein (DUF1800 family)
MLDDATALHLVNRLGFGPTPGDLEHVRQAGFEGYIEEQLHSDTDSLPLALQQQLQRLPSFGKNTFELYRDFYWKIQLPDEKGTDAAKVERRLLASLTQQVPVQARIARLARAIASPHRLHEVLVDFWFSHFNVFEHKGLDKLWVGAFEAEAIRPHMLGRFSDLLLATAKHPAMLVYLDNWQNVAPTVNVGGKAKGINENYAREVMELHTLGVDGGYTQKDVTSLAHILTGWTIGTAPGRLRGGFAFLPQWHDTSPQILLGKSFANAGYADGEAALLMLAHHPATARHISFKLAQYFVADDPPSELVNRLAETFRNTNGDLRAVLRAMFLSKQFRDPANFGRKFKTPYQYVVSVARATGLDPRNGAPLAEQLKLLGQPIYSCVTPDGYACTETAWLDPDAMMRRISFAVKFGSGAYMQSYLADVGYGTMGKPVRLQPTGGGTPLPSDGLIRMLSPILTAKTRATVAKAADADRAGLILGSPEFMRC